MKLLVVLGFYNLVQGQIRPYDRYPTRYHYERFKTENKWINKMSAEEWAFFTKEQNPCGELVEPENGKIACKLKRGTAYCRIKCDSGFLLGGNKIRAQWCLDGSWSPRNGPKCLPDPDFVPKERDTQFARSRNVLGSIYLSELKDIFGDELDVDVEKVVCPKLRQPENGVYWCDDDENDKSLCSFMCQEGYHPIGPAKKKCGCKSRECMWSPPEKSFCRKNPTCQNIQTPKNGRIECPVDSFCVVSCDEGFEMDNGIMERTLRCNCDFDDYMCQWDHQIPVCKPRNGCLDSMCDPNASCRHGPSGWGCTCNCGFYGDGRTCKQLTNTLPCAESDTTCSCRRGWQRPRENAECRLPDSTNLFPCKYHGDGYLKFLPDDPQLYKQLSATVDCSGSYHMNLSDLTIPGNTNTFILQHSNIDDMVELKEIFGNLLSLEVTNIGGNEISRLDHNLFENNCGLTTVNVGHGFVRPDVSPSLFYNSQRLRIADFSSLGARIPSQLFLTTNRLEWISLRGNEIPVLTTLIAKGKRRLEFLDLSNCQIRAVLDSAFQDAKSLKYLKLRNNKIRFLTAGQLKGLDSLESIDLFDNILESLGGDMFIDSPLLRQIDVSYNLKLRHICRSTFVRHEYLEVVNLRSNLSLHPSLRKKFCLIAGGDCEGSLLAMQRLLLIYGENC